MVAHSFLPHRRPHRLALLLLRLLGLLPSVQCSLHIPPRKKDANKRTILRNVPPLFLLPSQNSRRFTTGARTPHRIRADNLLDGRTQTRPVHFHPLATCGSVQCPCLAEPRPGHRRNSHGHKASHHSGFCYDPCFPHRRRLLHSTDSSLHSVAEVFELQLLLLQASARGAIQGGRLLRVLQRSLVPSWRLACRQVNGGSRPFVDRCLHSCLDVTRLPTYCLSRFASSALAT